MRSAMREGDDGAAELKLRLRTFDGLMSSRTVAWNNLRKPIIFRSKMNERIDYSPGFYLQF